jgi:hypothetical protein
MALRFDPPKQVARYALFVDYGQGRGYFKTYNELGHAKSAHAYHNAGTRCNAKILENVDGQWYVLHEVRAGMTYSDLPWVKEVSTYRWNGTPHKKGVPMSRDEYAEWRLAVERERIADLSGTLDLNPGRMYTSSDQYSTN